MGGMSSLRGDVEPDQPVEVRFLPENGAHDTVALSDWLALVAQDEAVTLPQPAAAYLAEARVSQA
jgi:hypothetical protein